MPKSRSKLQQANKSEWTRDLVVSEDLLFTLERMCNEGWTIFEVIPRNMQYEVLAHREKIESVDEA